MSLFNRIANVTIVSDRTGISENDLEINISGLKIDFNIVKTESSEHNSCNISIWNLSENTRNLINSTDDLLTLWAGYEDAGVFEVIFKGNISLVGHKIEKPNIITEIRCGDGEKELKNAKSSLSYRGQASLKRALRNVIKDFNIGEKIKFDLLDIKDVILNNGFSFSGLSKTAMDKITKNLNLKWSIQNNEIKVYNDDGTDNYILIETSPSSGLIGTPRKIKVKQSKKTKEKELDGWEVLTLLEPKAEPGGRIIINSKVIPENSQFKILRVNHFGNNKGEQNFTKMEVVEI